MRLLSCDEHERVFTDFPHGIDIWLDHHFALTRPGIEMCLCLASRERCFIDEECCIGIRRYRRLYDSRRPSPLNKEIREE